MTLLVAGACEGGAWMVADTAITGETMPTRSREYRIKIEPIQESALIGFANVPSVATQTIRSAATKPQGMQTVEFLLQEHRKGQHADFIYAYLQDNVSHLYCIKDGKATKSAVAFIGSHDAFSAFQEIKHARTLNPAPDAMHIFLAGHAGTSPSPNEQKPQLYTDVTAAILAMENLFSKSSERGVGGTAIPYIVTGTGTFLYNYGYSVTDPGINKLKPGSLVMHGTPQFGGYGVSVTELRERDGIVIYWLQRPGGIVWLKSNDWYEPHHFSGSPSQFKAAVSTTLGREVDLWFGDEEQGAPESLRLLHDHVGRPRLIMAESRRSLSFSWMQGSEDDFSISSEALKIGDAAMSSEQDEPNAQISAKCVDDGVIATLTLTDGSTTGSVQLSASELDNLIRHLARIRSEMTPEVPIELEKGKAINAVTDPVWRTRPMLHPSMPGELLLLRHRGLGWLGFVLPPHEVAALGAYLVKSSEQ
ncbi:hypothetical protein [Pseudoduganella violacea]|uniref:Uncharacterized protein n=1 Tax=Pseudoduganella violacea TaxID=1715466 RepID=A0A7W5BHR3_9BURK|nr:hypothetical protein [Pseudoduganella violacea]MBB3122460.1 hypothetical protein [Pseudoduganella violacea]